MRIAFLDETAAFGPEEFLRLELGAACLELAMGDRTYLDVILPPGLTLPALSAFFEGYVFPEGFVLDRADDRCVFRRREGWAVRVVKVAERG